MGARGRRWWGGLLSIGLLGAGGGAAIFWLLNKPAKPDLHVFDRSELRRASYWCCEAGSCWARESGPPEFFDSSKRRIVSADEASNYPKESLQSVWSTCAHILGYGGYEWLHSNPRYEGGTLLDDALFTHEQRYRAFVFTFRDPVREELHFRAYLKRPDCLDARHGFAKSARDEEHVDDVSECARVRLDGTGASFTE